MSHVFLWCCNQMPVSLPEVITRVMVPGDSQATRTEPLGVTLGSPERGTRHSGWSHLWWRSIYAPCPLIQPSALREVKLPSPWYHMAAGRTDHTTWQLYSLVALTLTTCRAHTTRHLQRGPLDGVEQQTSPGGYRGVDILHSCQEAAESMSQGVLQQVVFGHWVNVQKSTNHSHFFHCSDKYRGQYY